MAGEVVVGGLRYDVVVNAAPMDQGIKQAQSKFATWQANAEATAAKVGAHLGDPFKGNLSQGDFSLEGFDKAFQGMAKMRMGFGKSATMMSKMVRGATTIMKTIGKWGGKLVPIIGQISMVWEGLKLIDSLTGGWLGTDGWIQFAVDGFNKLWQLAIDYGSALKEEVFGPSEKFMLDERQNWINRQLAEEEQTKAMKKRMNLEWQAEQDKKAAQDASHDSFMEKIEQQIIRTRLGAEEYRKFQILTSEKTEEQKELQLLALEAQKASRALSEAKTGGDAAEIAAATKALNIAASAAGLNRLNLGEQQAFNRLTNEKTDREIAKEDAERDRQEAADTEAAAQRERQVRATEQLATNVGAV